jgi:uncharacterized protein DUF1214
VQEPYGNVLHIAADGTAPVEAFWSLTMYDAEGFQIPHPIDRFAIGDRDPLQYNTDGSLDLRVQAQSPGTDKEPNWLPAPEGPFSLLLRLCGPKLSALDGRWNPPRLTHPKCPPVVWLPGPEWLVGGRPGGWDCRESAQSGVQGVGGAVSGRGPAGEGENEDIFWTSCAR